MKPGPDVGVGSANAVIVPPVVILPTAFPIESREPERSIAPRDDRAWPRFRGAIGTRSLPVPRLDAEATHYHRRRMPQTQPTEPTAKNARNNTPIALRFAVIRPRLLGTCTHFALVGLGNGDRVEDDAGRVMRPVLLPVIVSSGVSLSVPLGFDG